MFDTLSQAGMIRASLDRPSNRFLVRGQGQNRHQVIYPGNRDVHDAQTHGIYGTTVHTEAQGCLPSASCFRPINRALGPKGGADPCASVDTVCRGGGWVHDPVV